MFIVAQVFEIVYLTSRIINQKYTVYFQIFKVEVSLCWKCPLDWDLDEVLLLALPKKDGWGGLAGGPRAIEVAVSR